MQTRQRLVSSNPISSTPHQTAITQVIDAFLPQFHRVLQSHVLFNSLFLTLGAIEFILLVVFFTMLAKSAVLAFSLAVVFLTFFAYFLFRLYFQTKKPEQFEALRQRYLTACKNVLRYRPGNPDSHTALVAACTLLSERLHGTETNLYHAPDFLRALDPYLKLFSQWRHWEDVQEMRALLLASAVREQVQRVIHAPTNSETHAALAQAYLEQAELYALLPPHASPNEEPLLRSKREDAKRAQRCRNAIQRAVEELQIVREFSPENPWVHEQLASCYRVLQIPDKELQAYERLLDLNAQDTNILCALGKLYFQQGRNAEGLRLYAKLQETFPAKAIELLRYYGAYPFEEDAANAS